MLSRPATPDPPLPPRISWFAPWRWSGSAQGALFLLLPVIYVESPVPIEAVGRMGYPPPAIVMQPLVVIWTPLIWGYNNIPAIGSFYDWQFKTCAEAIKHVTGTR
jgi:hypothetical protein